MIKRALLVFLLVEVISVLIGVSVMRDADPGAWGGFVFFAIFPVLLALGMLFWYSVFNLIFWVKIGQ